MLKLLAMIITYLENALGLFFLAAMVIVVALQVFSRYASETPVSWTEEAARYSLIWLTFIGSSMAIRTRGHFAVELLVHKLPDRLKAVAEFVLLLVMAVFAWVMLTKGASILPIVHYQTSPALDIPMSWVYSSIPVGAGLMLIRILIALAEKSCEFSASCRHIFGAAADPERRAE